MRFKALIIAGALALAALGFGVAAAATGGGVVTSTNCATTTAASHVIVVDGTPVTTVGGDMLAVCATATATDQTVTVTGSTSTPTTTTTTQATTTSGTTTTTSSGPTFASETAYAQNPPAFTPTRTILVSSASQLKSALTNLQPGDLVKASAPFTVSNGSCSTCNGLVISNRLSAPAEINLTGVTIEYTGTGQYNSIWIKNVQNVWLFGGNITMTQPTLGGGSCISWTGSQHSLWWGFDAHDCGSGGMGIFTAGPTYSFHGPVENNDIEGTIHHFSLNHGIYDNHQEKCTGLHGANLADNNWYAFDHNRIALNVYDSPCIGGGIEFGASKSPTTSTPGPIPTQNTIILQCSDLTFVSTIQTGSNCYQTWGYGETYTDIKFLNASNLMGHAYWPGGMYQKPSPLLATDTVEYGRAVNTDQNSRYARDCTFNKESGTVFQDVQPAPCYAPYTN